MKPLIVAHRGAMTVAPENTRPAFDKALACGMDGIELDVRITRDRVPVIFHDEILEKIGGGKQSVSDLTCDELEKYDWGGWFSPAFAGEKMLTLEAVLTAYGSRTCLMIEIKPSPGYGALSLYNELAAMVVEQVRNLVPRNRLQHMYILSFDPMLIQTGFLNDPSLNYVLNLHKGFADLAGLNIDPSILCGVCMHHSLLSRELVEKMQDAGRQVMTYSCNRPETLDRLLDLAVDVIMTDVPAHAMWKAFEK